MTLSLLPSHADIRGFSSWSSVPLSEARHGDSSRTGVREEHSVFPFALVLLLSCWYGSSSLTQIHRLSPVWLPALKSLLWSSLPFIMKPECWVSCKSSATSFPPWALENVFLSPLCSQGVKPRGLLQMLSAYTHCIFIDTLLLPAWVCLVTLHRAFSFQNSQLEMGYNPLLTFEFPNISRSFYLLLLWLQA